MFKKRIEVDALIPYSRIMEAQVEPSGPHSGKIVIRDDDSKQLAQIAFSANEEEHCMRVMEALRQAWALAQ